MGGWPVLCPGILFDGEARAEHTTAGMHRGVRWRGRGVVKRRSQEWLRYGGERENRKGKLEKRKTAIRKAKRAGWKPRPFLLCPPNPSTSLGARGGRYRSSEVEEKHKIKRPRGGSLGAGRMTPSRKSLTSVPSCLELSGWDGPFASAQCKRDPAKACGAGVSYRAKRKRS